MRSNKCVSHRAFSRVKIGFLFYVYYGALTLDLIKELYLTDEFAVNMGSYIFRFFNKELLNKTEHLLQATEFFNEAGEIHGLALSRYRDNAEVIEKIVKDPTFLDYIFFSSYWPYIIFIFVVINCAVLIFVQSRYRFRHSRKKNKKKRDRTGLLPKKLKKKPTNNTKQLLKDAEKQPNKLSNLTGNK